MSIIQKFKYPLVFILGSVVGGATNHVGSRYIDEHSKYNEVVPLAVVSEELAQANTSKTETLSRKESYDFLIDKIDLNKNGRLDGADEIEAFHKELDKLYYLGGKHRNVYESIRNLKAAANVISDRNWLSDSK